MALKDYLKQVYNDDWLSQELDKQAESSEEWRHPLLRMRPSSAGTDCVRAAQLSMLGHRGSNTAKSMRRMLNGTLSHDRWTEELEDAGLLVVANERLDVPSENWSGELDAIVKHPIAHRNHIAEIKTMNARRYRNVPPQKKDYTEMAQVLLGSERGYVYQLTQYIVMFQAHYKTHRVEDVGIFIFENTDTQEYKVRYLLPTPEMRVNAFRVQREALEKLQQTELVDAPYVKMSQTCRWCSHESLCYALQDGDEELTEFVRERINGAID